MKRKPLVAKQITESLYKSLLNGCRASRLELLAAHMLLESTHKRGFYCVKIGKKKIPVYKEEKVEVSI